MGKVLSTFLKSAKKYISSSVTKSLLISDVIAHFSTFVTLGQVATPT